MSEDRIPFPPAALFRSFLLVAGAYLSNILLLLMAIGVISMTLFPDSYQVLNAEPDEFNKIFETDPQRVFPPAMLWILLVVSGLVCFGLGYLVARLAPLGRFSHAILFAVILFVQYLQLAIGALESLQTMLILFMAVSPVASLLGAHMYLSGSQQE